MLSTVVVKRSLCDANDAIAHVLWDETVIVPDDADDRNIDVGKMSVGVRTIASEPRITMSMEYHKRIGSSQRESKQST